MTYLLRIIDQVSLCARHFFANTGKSVHFLFRMKRNSTPIQIRKNIGKIAFRMTGIYITNDTNNSHLFIIS